MASPFRIFRKYMKALLVVFGVMLTAQGPFVSMKAGAAEWGLSVLVGVMLLGALIATTVFSSWPTRVPESASAATSTNTSQLGQAFLGLPDATPAGSLTGIPASAGVPPIRKQVAYLLPFEIVSVHLTVVLIGAAYLARAKRRRPAGG